MMTHDEAVAVLGSRDIYTIRLCGLRVHELAETYRIALANRGMRSLLGGPRKKDELISSLVLLLYPIAEQNEATHVLFHEPGEWWSACEHCHPHGGQRCDCARRLEVLG